LSIPARPRPGSTSAIPLTSPAPLLVSLQKLLMCAGCPCGGLESGEIEPDAGAVAVCGEEAEDGNGTAT